VTRKEMADRGTGDTGEASLMFELGIDSHCHQCGKFVPASTQHNCRKPRDEDEIERVRRLSK